MAGKDVLYQLVKNISGKQVASWFVQNGYDRIQDLLIIDKVLLTKIFEMEKEITKFEKALKEGSVLYYCSRLSMREKTAKLFVHEEKKTYESNKSISQTAAF